MTMPISSTVIMNNSFCVTQLVFTLLRFSTKKLLISILIRSKVQIIMDESTKWVIKQMFSDKKRERRCIVENIKSFIFKFYFISFVAWLTDRGSLKKGIFTKNDHLS